jgi:hypothetical protein
LTEGAVVAAQALRWHGAQIVGDLPFWVLGWIFIAQPVFESLLLNGPHGTHRLRREILRHATTSRRPWPHMKATTAPTNCSSRG